MTAIYQAVIQINKFKLANGSHPNRLDELSSIPIDPLDDQRLVYERHVESFRIETRNEPEGFPFRFESK